MQILTWHIRDKLNMTLEEMEKVTGVSKTTLNDIENGKVSPTISTLERISNGLKIPVTSFLTQDFRNTGNNYGKRDKNDNRYYNENRKKKGVVTKKQEEQYKTAIHHMVDQISDIKFLKRIYNLVLFLFLKTPG